jgi:hypothetical protein
MGHGQQKASVMPSFNARIDDLIAKAKEWSDALRYGRPRRWYVPDGTKEPLDVPSLSVPAWERNDINQKYSVDVCGDASSPGTSADAMGLKWQADFMAVEERAFRTRHASLPRCMAAAHGRLSGHGNPTGGVFNQLREATGTTISDGGLTG